jgi:uncharacterized protein (DUF952 family)
MTLLHLCPASEWIAGQHAGRYRPSRFVHDGFVHCCDDLETAQAIAAAYFSSLNEPLLLVSIDESRLDVEVRREPPAAPDGQVHRHHDGRRFPHIYGSVPLAAVVSCEPLVLTPK